MLLHATLEDLLRAVAEEWLPRASPEVLGQFPLAGSRDARKTTFSLKELAAHRGKTVDQVIEASVVAALDRMSFNQTRDIVQLLENLGLGRTLVDPFERKLRAMMSRRHLIAHRFDRNVLVGRGQHSALSINRLTVERWLSAVERFGLGLLRGI